MILSHCSERILARPSLQRRFSSLNVYRYSFTHSSLSSLQSYHNISIRLRSGFWLDHWFFSFSLIFFRLVCSGSLTCCMTQFEPHCFTHITHFGIQSSLCSTHWLQGAQIPWLQNKAKFHTQVVWGVVIDMLRWRALNTNIFTLVSYVQRTLFQKSCSLLDASLQT